MFEIGVCNAKLELFCALQTHYSCVLVSATLKQGRGWQAVFGLIDLKKDYFPKGSTIVVVHKGGLQGIVGYEKRYGISIF